MSQVKGGVKAALGPLPDFLIVGAMRSGSTSLARYLGTHPEVYMASDKELHFFDRNFHKGIDWYKEQFLEATTEATIGEATPHYMFNEAVPARMAEVLPRARLIAILRNPTDRAYSHYWFRRVRGRESRGFPEAIDAELDRNADGHRNGIGPGYVERGRYLTQLLHFRKYYGEEALHVVLFEDLRDRPGETFTGVCRFIGVNDGFVPPNLGQSINRYFVFRSVRLHDLVRRRRSGTLARIAGRLNRREATYPPIDRKMRERLNEVFKEDNEALASWLGRELSTWTK